MIFTKIIGTLYSLPYLSNNLDKLILLPVDLPKNCWMSGEQMLHSRGLIPLQVWFCHLAQSRNNILKENGNFIPWIGGKICINYT